MTSKWSVRPLVINHLRTLVDQRTDKYRATDYLTFYGFPFLLGLVSYFTDFRLKGVEGLLSGVSVFTALLFGLLVHVFMLGLRVTDDPRVPKGGRTSKLVDQLVSNVAYAVLAGIMATAVLMVAVSTTEKDRPLSVAISAVVVALLVHLLLTIFMALKRTQAAYIAFRS